MPENNIDKLNVVYKNRAEPYEEYFDVMEISEEQKEERIEASYDFEEDMFFFITMIVLLHGSGYSDYSTAVKQFTDRYTNNVSKYIDDRDFLLWYPLLFANDMLDSTLRNIDNPWYSSFDRAMFNAENEANAVLNRSEFIKAILAGKRYKTWHDMADRRVRETHRIVGGRTVPIGSVFSVGNALMRFPHDYEMASDNPEELINCRCSITYK